MSFIDHESIMRLTEDLFAESWLEEFGEIKTPFDRMRYNEAMELYGSDKPDLRLPFKVKYEQGSPSFCTNDRSYHLAPNLITILQFSFKISRIS